GRYLDRADLFAAVTESGGVRAEGQLEPLVPPCRGPHLIRSGQIRHVAVLHAAQVPHQPSDRIRLRIGPPHGHRCGQVVAEVSDMLADPFEVVGDHTAQHWCRVVRIYLSHTPWCLQTRSFFADEVEISTSSAK